jgi:hypothetical protein
MLQPPDYFSVGGGNPIFEQLTSSSSANTFGVIRRLRIGFRSPVRWITRNFRDAGEFLSEFSTDSCIILPVSPRVTRLGDLHSRTRIYIGKALCPMVQPETRVRSRSRGTYKDWGTTQHTLGHDETRTKRRIEQISESSFLAAIVVVDEELSQPP